MLRLLTYLLTVCLLMGPQLYAQDYVSGLLKGSTAQGCRGCALKTAPDNNIFISYSCRNVLSTRGVLKVTPQGTIIFDKEYLHPSLCRNAQLKTIAIKDTLLFLGSAQSTPASTDYRAHILQCNLNGDTIQSKIFKSNTATEDLILFDFLVHPDSGFIITAVVDEDTNQIKGNLCLIRLDDNLNEIYRKVYGHTGVNEEPNALAFLGGENYVLHYKTKKYVTESPFYEGEYHENYLLKINENGTYSNRKINRFKQMEGGALNLLVENNRILFGSYHSLATEIYDDTTTGVVMEYSLDLDLIDIHPISELSGQAAGFHSIKQHPDGGYALIGQYIPQTDDPFDDWSGKIWYARVDEQWNLQESSLFVFPGYDAPNLKLASIVDFDFLPSGELIGVGQVLDLGSSGQRIWYLKQGSDGCFDAACNWLNLQEQNPQHKPALLLYPNPVQDQVQIAWQGKGLYELRIYDMQGGCVSTISQNPAAIPLQVFVPHFKPGMYTLQVLQNGQLMASAKMIKQ